MAKRYVNPNLSGARSYWRLAAKAEKAGNYAAAAHLRGVGDRKFATYEREEAYRKSRQQARNNP